MRSSAGEGELPSLAPAAPETEIARKSAITRVFILFSRRIRRLTGHGAFHSVASPRGSLNLLDRAGRPCAGGTARFAGIDMPSVAPAWAVINVGERGVEVRIGLDQIRHSVCGKIGVH